MLRLPATIAVIVISLMGAIGGCLRLSTSTSAVSLTTHNVSHIQQPQTPTAPLAGHSFIGRSSCSATACHGHTTVGTSGWENAYQRWDTADPHRRAFDVLYSERSVHMFRKLTQTETPQIDDTTYLRFLENRCIGCHATPPVKAIAGANLRPQATPDAYWQGVSCESCHGPAQAWVDHHYLLPANNDPGHDAARATLSTVHGFVDLQSLEIRAGTCVKCHVGPQAISGATYDVNHDLIAAGHPRLHFELHAYLANLPKHWKEESEQSAPDFHFETWRVGQLAKAKQEIELKASRPAGKWNEFANHDCRECHRPIGETSYPLRASRSLLDTPALRALARPTTIAQRSNFLRVLIDGQRETTDSVPTPGCDEAVEIYLAAAALARDLPAPTIAAEIAALHRAISAQAGVTQYDLPATFNPQAGEFRQAISALDAALERLSRQDAVVVPNP